MATPSILKQIIQTKIEEVNADKIQRPLSELIIACDNLTRTMRGFADALRNKNSQVGIISEIKKASPSRGIISPNFNPTNIAYSYEQSGATCLSVLTDVHYFKGSNSYLQEAHKASTLPILRKDFMIDEYQIYQSYLLGADCILIIMACLDDYTTYTLHQIAIELGMDVLIEVHTEDELNRALKLPHSKHNIYGINNRDLNTFRVDLQHSIRLKDKLLAELGNNVLIVSESGISNSTDIHLMQNNGINNFLIGEQFMKTNDPAGQLHKLLNSIEMKE